jgi:hypothetical protein
MEIALSRDDYSSTQPRRRLRSAARIEAERSLARPVGLDVCRLLVAVFGLMVYLGPPVLALGYLASQLLH